MDFFCLNISILSRLLLSMVAIAGRFFKPHTLPKLSQHHPTSSNLNHPLLTSLNVYHPLQTSPILPNRNQPHTSTTILNQPLPNKLPNLTITQISSLSQAKQIWTNNQTNTNLSQLHSQPYQNPDYFSQPNPASACQPTQRHTWSILEAYVLEL